MSSPDPFASDVNGCSAGSIRWIRTYRDRTRRPVPSRLRATALPQWSRVRRSKSEAWWWIRAFVERSCRATEQDDVLRLKARVDNLRPPTGPRSTRSQSLEPTSLFDGFDPDEFFARNGISVTSALATPFQDGEAMLWTLSISDSEASSRGCALGEPCIQFAEFNDGDDRLMLFAGVGNDIDLISLGEGDEQLLVFAKNRSPLLDRFRILDDLRITEN